MSGATASYNGAGRGGAGAEIPKIKVAQEDGHEGHSHGDKDVVDAGLRSLDHCELATRG